MNIKSVLKVIGIILAVASVVTAVAAIAYKITERINRKSLAAIECDGENTKISA